MRTRLQMLVVAGTIIVVICGAVVFFVQVHAATADWWPGAIPTRVQYEGRNFTCLSGGRKLAATRDDLMGLEARGHTIGGGTIYAPPGLTLPLGIVVASGDELRQCSLSGGP
ncbi:hypothetical protein ACFVWR_13330 [Leifsonia sp. NPDC058292]|uniref:hypothetical protein n=1 Tax=Leifsonia sp. NPDC058292 TaxID=3346428 RepID=UPI0036D9485A